MLTQSTVRNDGTTAVAGAAGCRWGDDVVVYYSCGVLERRPAFSWVSCVLFSLNDFSFSGLMADTVQRTKR